MARIAIFTDRSERDCAWKGPIIWNWIKGLLESDHQIMVITTVSPSEIEITHSRLTVVNPAPNWSAKNLPKFLKALVPFQPNVVHSIGLDLGREWKYLSVWPLLNAVIQIFPGIRRYSTFFDEEDLLAQNAAKLWHSHSMQWTVLSTELKISARKIFSGPIDLAPVDLEFPAYIKEAPLESDQKYLLIPASIDHWKDSDAFLIKARKMLLDKPQLHLRVVGGWGEFPLSRRQKAWQALMPVAHRIHMLDLMPLDAFMAAVKNANSVWTEPLELESWPAIVAGALAEKFKVALIGPDRQWLTGSTVNYLSRLYASERA